MRAYVLPAMLVVASMMTACQTHTSATSVAVETAVTGVCTVWLPVTYSSRDTEITVAEIRANNRARDAFCGSAQ